MTKHKFNRRLPVARKWRRCKPGMVRRVDFASGVAIVRLLTTFVYRWTDEGRGGRVYRVEDVATGRQDIVGIEFLKRVA